MACKKTMPAYAGFTLLEMSISLLIVAMIVAMVMSTSTTQVSVDKRAELTRKLDKIGEALYFYRTQHQKLPCPGNASLARTNAKFGMQADSAAGACNSGATVSSNINNANNTVFGGSVPVRTLGLADEYAFDPWGNQFTYYVDKNSNDMCNFTGNRGTAGITGTGNLNVEDESGTTLTDTILATVISHGPNGHGAFNAAGTRISAGATNAAEQENCMCNASAAATTDTVRLIRIQRTLPTSSSDIKTMFDDVGRFYNKSYFYTYSERNPT